MKKKKIKKPKHLETDILIMILVLLFIIVIVFSLEFVLKPKDITTTTVTTTIFPTTTIPTIQTCSNFTWTIDDITEFDLRGGFRMVVIDFTTEYIGPEEEDYGWAGSHQFKILDNEGKYYNPQEAYYRCEAENVFKLGVLNYGNKTSGCLEFRVPDSNEPTKLVFYDYIIGKMCEIDLS